MLVVNKTNYEAK